MIVTVLDLDKLRGAACVAEYGHMHVTGDVMCALLDRLAAAERDARAVEAAALERALRTIRAVRMDDGKAGQHRAWYGGIDDCAAAIRAMIPKAQGARDE